MAIVPESHVEVSLTLFVPYYLFYCLPPIIFTFTHCMLLSTFFHATETPHLLLLSLYICPITSNPPQMLLSQ